MNRNVLETGVISNTLNSGMPLMHKAGVIGIYLCFRVVNNLFINKFHYLLNFELNVEPSHYMNIQYVIQIR